MQLQDKKNSYGWISILLHWLTATLILCIWFIGNSIGSENIEHRNYWQHIHISVGLSSYFILLFRILWRFKSGHPVLIGQSRTIHTFGKIAHYLMLLFLIILLLSGPMIILMTGNALTIFDWISIESPFKYSQHLSNIAYQFHFFASSALILTVCLHISAAFKHMMFHEDETFARIFRPRKSHFDKNQSLS
jgi:cytochrome b561